jgi:hypothetical protein
MTTTKAKESEMSNIDRDFARADARALRAAVKISDEINRMIGDLPETVATQYVLNAVILPELARRQPWIMQLILEDHDTREAYYTALARVPASAP